MTERHRLSETDTEARKAVCSICGPVRIRVRKGRSPRCWTIHSAEAAKYRATRSPESRRNQKLRSLYGITLEDQRALETAQGGKCAICLQPGSLVVDHNHTTGRVRGLLCTPCNTAIGSLREDRSIFVRAVEYLDQHKVN